MNCSNLNNMQNNWQHIFQSSKFKKIVGLNEVINNARIPLN